MPNKDGKGPKGRGLQDGHGGGKSPKNREPRDGHAEGIKKENETDKPAGAKTGGKKGGC
jgi:hypothetical protein